MLKERRPLQQKNTLSQLNQEGAQDLQVVTDDYIPTIKTYNKDTKLCRDTTSRSRQRRQIWAILFKDSHIASILGPKLLGLYK